MNPENKIEKISLRQSAFIAGTGLLLMAIFGPFANFTIIQGLFDPDDVTKTINNIIASNKLYRLGL